ncbi:MAG TPA: hypothetical protein VFZ00_13035, partial [Solirubrobacter sp.]|nr:hypothetical protein [Solirubrobacter sp.]
VEEMIKLVEKAADIDPMRCRQTAAERFAPDRVAAGYEAVYREAVRRRPAARQGAHRTRATTAAG